MFSRIIRKTGEDSVLTQYIPSLIAKLGAYGTFHFPAVVNW